MKSKLTCQTILAIAILFYFSNTKAQVTVANNNSLNSATDYVGWDANETDPLVIATKAAYNINFQTAATQRMTILGTAGATQGFVGIGTNAPQSPLHLHGTLQLTSAATNAGAGDGLLLRNSVTGGPVDFVQQETNAFRFFTPGSSGVQKMIITSAGEVGIGTMSNPGNRCEIESGNSIQLRLTYTGTSSYFTTLGANTNGDFQIFANKGADERGVVIGTR